jgi:hypothetical protein
MYRARVTSIVRVCSVAAALATAAAGAAEAVPVGTPGYTVSVFATAPAGSSKPDSIAIACGDVFVGYGNGGNPDGSGGATSTIAKFGPTGSLLGMTTVVGHNDGLRYDPYTGQMWALQNEDANPNLVLINPANLGQSGPYGFSATPHGGGYDDAAFLNGNTFISASNPANNPNTAPALVSAMLSGSTVKVTGVLNGNASVSDINTGGTTTLNLQDPDSLAVTPAGGLALDSQGDMQLVFVDNPGQANQSASVLNLSNMVDDTVFASGVERTLLFADKGDNTVYEVTGTFAPGTAYSAAASNSGVAGTDFIGELDLLTGDLTPIVTGANNPGGEAFLSVAAPEPSSLAVLGFAMIGLFGFLRRRQA